MRFRSVAAALAFGSCTALALAQQDLPKPGPDTHKLDAFVGKWEGEGEMKAGPWGAGGKMKNEDECKWFQGGWQLVCESEGEGAMGEVKGHGVMAWSPEDKVYKYMGYDSMGMMMHATGTVSGNTWSWKGQDKMGGKLIKQRYTVTLTSPTTQTFKWETSEDGKTWSTLAQGSSKKK
jgi:hypothetical protein